MDINQLDKSIIVYTLQDGKYIGSKPFVPDEVVNSTVLAEFQLEVEMVFKD